MRRVGLEEYVEEAAGKLPDPIDLDRDQELLASYGLTPEAIKKAMFTLVNGARVTEIHQDQRVYDVVHVVRQVRARLRRGSCVSTH